MKIRFYIGIWLLVTGVASCNNWLDVKPQTEMTLKEMFADQQGFQDALTGAYLELKSTSAYGEELMFGTVEFLAQHWDYTAESTEEKISQFNYRDNDVRSRFDRIYTQLYKIITSVNAILENIDTRRDIFEKGMYEIIKGEALAMRAYCHLDLLRLFGPMPTQTGSLKILPYVKTVTIDYHPHATYPEYVELLEEDLLAAEQLLKTSDPIIPELIYTINELSIAARNFLQARQLRFNYYAVKATEARFYLWVGGDNNKTKAYRCANELIESQGTDSTSLFVLGSSNSITRKDYSFSSEHIMAVYDYKLKERADNCFTVEAPYSKDANVLSPDLYPAGTTDIRRISLWNSNIGTGGYKTNSPNKFLQTEEAAINQLPLIRLAEMYFIAMECGSLEDASRLYKKFCLSRDITPVEFKNFAQVEQTLITEYNKEFYAEGQAFYAFKRLAVEAILWAMFPGNSESYVIPLPLDEINYGS